MVDDDSVVAVTVAVVVGGDDVVVGVEIEIDVGDDVVAVDVFVVVINKQLLLRILPVEMHMKMKIRLRMGREIRTMMSIITLTVKKKKTTMMLM